MEALSEDVFPDVNQSHSKNFLARKRPAKSKKRVLKQLTIFDVDSQQQNLFTAKMPKQRDNVLFLNKQKPPLQMNTDNCFQEAQKQTPLFCKIPGQIVDRLQETKENIEYDTVGSKVSSENLDGSEETSVRILTNLETCKYIDIESNTNCKERETSGVRETETSKTIENSVMEDECNLADTSFFEPDTCFVDWESPLEARDTGFSVPNTHVEGLETPPTDNSELLKTPMNFSTVTVSELGITPEIFTFKSTERSQSALKRLKRRSTVGLRGSPETDCLIRYIARQKHTAKEDPLDQTSPFRPGRHSSLKEKISAFRASFLSLEENEVKVVSPGFLEEGALQAKTTSVESSIPKPHEKPDLRGEPPLQLKKVSVTEQSKPCAANKSLSNESTSEGTSCQRTAAKAVTTDWPVSVTTNLRCSTFKIASEVEGWASPASERWTAAFAMGRKVVFGEQSPEVFDRTLPPGRPLQLGESPVGMPLKQSPFLRPVLKKTPTKHGKEYNKGHELVTLTEEVSLSSESMNTSVTQSPKYGKIRTVVFDERGNISESKELQKRKKVTFGRDLSPEIFDKMLPPNTPLRRGRTPDRGVNSSFINIPIEAPPAVRLEPIEQPNFDNVDESVPVVLHTRDLTASPTIAENVTTSPVTDSQAQQTWVLSVLESELIHIASASDSPLKVESLMDTDQICLQESQDKNAAEYSSPLNTCEEASLSGGRMTRSALKRKSVPLVETTASGETFSLEASSIKQKLTNEDQPAKAKRPRKITSKKRASRPKYVRRKGKGNKTVKKAIYGARETVSKKPLLSPIFEVPEIFSSTPSISPALRKAQAAEDASASSDDCREAVTIRKVTRKRRSVRGMGRSFTSSSEDSTCDESENEQESRSVDTSQMDESENEQVSGSDETTQMSFEDQCVHENKSPCMGQINNLEAASAISTGMIGDSSVIGTTYSAVMNEKEQFGKTVNEESPAIPLENIIVPHAITGSPENRPLNFLTVHASTAAKLRRQSRRHSFQISVPTAAKVSSTTHEPSGTETAQRLPLSRTRKLGRLSCETIQTTEDVLESVCVTRKNSSVIPILEDTVVPGSGSSGYNQDDIFPSVTEYHTKSKPKKTSKNTRRNTIFCFHPDNCVESTFTAIERDLPVPPLEHNVVPSSTDGPEACESDNSFNIEETLQKVTAVDRPVRRSMRLRRDSGVVGLSWINECGQEKETLNVAVSNSTRKSRRSAVNTPTLKESNSPTPKTKVTSSSRGKENCEHLSLLGSSVKSNRRRTLCAFTLQGPENEAGKNKRGRRSCKGVEICSVKVEKVEPQAVIQPNNEHD